LNEEKRVHCSRLLLDENEEEKKGRKLNPLSRATAKREVSLVITGI